MGVDLQAVVDPVEAGRLVGQEDPRLQPPAQEGVVDAEQHVRGRCVTGENRLAHQRPGVPDRDLLDIDTGGNGERLEDAR